MSNAELPKELDLILSHRFKATQHCEYLVQWSSDQAKTWEPSSNLQDCAQCLATYWRSFVIKSPNHPFLLPLTAATAAAAAAATPLATATRSPARKPKALVANPSRAKKDVSETEEDQIAVAKRVQMNKQLRGARGRAGVALAVAVAGGIADVVESGAAGDVSVGSMQKPGVSAREENAPKYSKPPPPTRPALCSEPGNLPAGVPGIRWAAPPQPPPPNND
ncbi:hypothetical protein BX661DRAFT_181053 [Kickxella alabastrina]|uniref:uncharacterized protein n=1 Tax=Kickxella alabastrina TaxID=61397 RepID=UPI00221F3044|nr:uncharacterized protein BX661DRAFT_181053 [Kickxella alabastrina]KAI7830081.1 hypothetical protein BX661DRAFT_181053 [Kickxella alabastrina]